MITPDDITQPGMCYRVRRLDSTPVLTFPVLLDSLRRPLVYVVVSTVDRYYLGASPVKEFYTVIRRKEWPVHNAEADAQSTS